MSDGKEKINIIDEFEKEFGHRQTDAEKTYFNEYQKEVTIVVWNDSFVKWLINRVEDLNDKTKLK